MQDWLRSKFTDYTPGVTRVFIICDDCKRVVPHYIVSGPRGRTNCRCGGTTFRPRRISEVRAAWWVLVAGLLWRKTILQREDWDARLPVRDADSKYA
jgi:hypothetical protein